jgi:hypothetical protein
MNETSNPPSLLGQALLDAIRHAVKEAILEAGGNGKPQELLAPVDRATELQRGPDSGDENGPTGSGPRYGAP